MAYVYSDWASQATIPLRYARILLHIDEVSALMQSDVASDGQSESFASLQAYLQGLYLERDKLEQSPANIPGGGFFKIRRTR